MTILFDNVSFNTQPPEGGCATDLEEKYKIDLVSTHSRPKAAALNTGVYKMRKIVSTHSRPKAAASFN